MDTTLNDKQIEESALTLLESVFGPVASIKFPIDMNRIVESYGLSIKQGAFEDPDIEGVLDRSKRTVYLSEDDTFEGKNFTLAHEVGHYKLHDQVNVDIFTMHQLHGLLERQGKNPLEDQADNFAASLLMPKQAVIELWDASGRRVETMSRIFGVPIAVVMFRLRKLGLIKE